MLRILPFACAKFVKTLWIISWKNIGKEYTIHNKHKIFVYKIWLKIRVFVHNPTQISQLFSTYTFISYDLLIGGFSHNSQALLLRRQVKN